MQMRATLFLLLATMVACGGDTSGGPAAAESCDLPASGADAGTAATMQMGRGGDDESAFLSGDFVEITIGDTTPPCRLVFNSTGVVLRGDPSGSRPDPGTTVVSDRNGRFYSANAQGFQSVISLWSPEGEFIRAFGSPGEGPGELSPRGGLAIQTDGANRLHVRDGGIRWTVFNEDQSFLRTTPVNLSTSRYIAFLDDGTVLSAPIIPADHYFQLIDPTGTLLRSFGPVDPAHSAATAGMDGRMIASDGGSTFWAAPPSSSGYNPDGYTLEEWSVEGRLLRRVRREVSWYPGAWPPPPPVDGPLIPSRPHQIAGLHLDGTGLLLVTISNQSERWRPVPLADYAALPLEERTAMYERRIELFETRTGTLLASQIVEPGDSIPGSLIPGTRLGYRSDSGPDLIPATTLVTFDLAPTLEDR